MSQQSAAEAIDEAAEDRASAYTALWAVAQALEDPRYQRPGMQRRRQWAQMIDGAMKVLAETAITDQQRTHIEGDALRKAAEDLQAIATISETPGTKVTGGEWLRYARHPLHDLPSTTLTRVADWLTGRSKDDR